MDSVTSVIQDGDLLGVKRALCELHPIIAVARYRPLVHRCHGVSGDETDTGIILDLRCREARSRIREYYPLCFLARDRASNERCSGVLRV